VHTLALFSSAVLIHAVTKMSKALRRSLADTAEPARLAVVSTAICYSVASTDDGRA
jgi:hypothetical protein